MDLEMRNILHAYKLPDTDVKTELEEASRIASQGSTKTLSNPEYPVQPKNSADLENSAQLESSSTSVGNTQLLVKQESSVESESQSQQQEDRFVKQPNKRKKTPEKLIIKKPRDNASYEMDSDSEADDIYSSVSNLQRDIECTTPKEKYPDEKSESQLVYQNTDDIKTTIKKLNDDKINVRKVVDKSPGNDGESVDDTSVTTEVSSHSVLVPDEDARDSDPLGTYGLKLEFLESLGIAPPIDRWVHVTNFRCDKFELRDVMELAGQVLSCSVINISRRFAKVQYSHPLEAVQAVSMLNDQIYFGLKLKVFIEKNSKNDIILPKGLVNIGLGLGLQGRPVRDIVSQYRKYARRQNSSINPILFRKSNYDYRNYNDDEEKTNDSQMDVEEYVASTKTSTFANDRSFKIKHVEDLDSNDGGKEKSKRNSSPESHSEKSVHSPVSNNSVREDKLNDLKLNTTINPSQPESNVALPLSLSRGHTSMSYPRSILPQNGPFRPQMSPAVPYIPSPSVPPMPDPNIPYTGPFKPGAFCNAVPNHVPNSVINQPQQSSAPLPLNYIPMANQVPTAPGPIHRPGPASMSGSGPPMSGSGPVQRQGTFAGPGPISGPVPAPGLISASGPAPGPISGLGSVPGPIHRPAAAPGQAMGLVQGGFPGPGAGHGPPSGPIGPGPIHGPQPGPSVRPGPVNRPVVPAPGHIGQATKKSTVQFSNLPPFTTFPYLCEKLSQCGQVLSMQFTTPGCAVATFTHPAHAERCFHTYNGMSVEGCRITVTLV